MKNLIVAEAALRIAAWVFVLGLCPTWGTADMKLADDADSAWQQLEDVLSMVRQGQFSTAAITQESYQLRHRYRAAGEAFWAKHPNDPRRFKWLEATTRQGWGIPYWRDVERGAMAISAGRSNEVEVDEDATAQWNRRLARYESEYLRDPANRQWREIEDLDPSNGSATQSRSWRARQYRLRGADFWREFPQDERRHEWLKKAVYYTPDYSSMDASELDGVWRRQYAQIRAEFLTSPVVTTEDRAHLLGAELFDRIYRMRTGGDRANSADRDALKYDLINAVFDYAVSKDCDSYQLHTCQSVLRTLLFGDEQAQRAAFSAFKNSQNIQLAEFGTAQMNVLQLRDEPLRLTFPSLDGRPVNYDALRGKVVLIDIWSNYCSACVEAMPKIREVYDKYKGNGLEVIGVWLATTSHTTEEKEMARARKIVAEKGAVWPNLVVHDPKNSEFVRTYGINGVPRYWLLGRDGRLLTEVAHANEIEQQIRNSLGL